MTVLTENDNVFMKEFITLNSFLKHCDINIIVICESYILEKMWKVSINDQVIFTTGFIHKTNLLDCGSYFIITLPELLGA